MARPPRLQKPQPEIPVIPLSQDEVDTWQALELLKGPDSILDWIPILSQDRQRPVHLTRLVDLLWRMQFGPIRAVCSIPPRFGKTETIIHAIVHRLMLDPTLEVIYCTHTASLAYTCSRAIRSLAVKAGVELAKDCSSVQEWFTAAGGKIRAAGVEGPITGKGCDLLVIDDAVKSRQEAESAVIRQSTWDWFCGTALTRVEPGGSVLVNATRWHDDDLIGRIMQAFPEWEQIQTPAVLSGPEGKEVSLWPERWPIELLSERKREVGDYEWASQFMAQPRPKGGRLFRAAKRYAEPLLCDPNVPYKIVIGADPAATAHTQSDYSAAVVLAVSGKFGSLDFRADVLEVYRAQVEIPEFVARLRDLAVKWAAPVVVEAVAGFKAVPQLLRTLDKRLKVMEAPVCGDKFTRALPAAAAWNDERIRVPESEPWVANFLSEIEKFTGVRDANDDQVDALVHAFNAAEKILPNIRYSAIEPRSNGLPFG